MITVAVIGCTACGKSTLAEALCALWPHCIVVAADDFFKKGHAAGAAPSLSLEALPWPSGSCPRAFQTKTTDTNVPDSIDWPALRAHICGLKQRPDVEVLLVEGFLLHTDAETMALVDRVIVIKAEVWDWPVLQQRKYTRAHLGKPSYAARGASAEEYRVYFEHYVMQRYEALWRQFPVPEPDVVLPVALPLDEMVQRVTTRICVG